ncbi:murein L,D-transpeptidase [Stappia stellulata]|uniref:L,D-transpeptidase family protein n=1 Tax=Stappia stellulata TaxID=71235 RepID=UPI001CD36445|nr:murein L,D-transpeptidase family protein [Stappia stellulata]MCA1244072.1 murein L,D-transpeptidase [Stappia stellulata]
MAQGIARVRSAPWKTLAVMALAGFLAACQADELGYGPKHKRPVSAEVKREITRLGMDLKSPIMLRIFKQESELEVWKQTKTGRYALLETFEICKWSGELGPKFKEGDRQAPEGFYEITPALMNPNSSYHLAFNLGYPNRYDRAHNRTGSHLMVHGACSSRGCYAMTDAQVQDIYALARESFTGGQRSFQVQAFPFRMTAENMAKHRDNEHYAFWQMLKRGHDHFEVTKVPPKVEVCEKQYVFDATPLVEGVPFRATAKCPAYDVPDSIEVAVNKMQQRDEEKVRQIAEAELRAEKRKAQLAAIFGGGSDANAAPVDPAADVQPTAPVASGAGVATASAPAAQPDQAASQTAFAPEPAPAKSSGGFFSRIFSSGNDAQNASVGTADPDAPLPAAKP